MAVKIPLKMSDGTPVKTIEELRDHFNLADVLGFYSNGRLVKWLTDWYYDEEAKRVESLDAKSGDFQKNLCEVLGVDYSKKEIVRVSLKALSERNERLERLREFTADEKILASVDRVIFTQKELEDCLMRDPGDVIYLCGEHFIIPAVGSYRKYIGINNPVVEFENIYTACGVDFQDLKFDISGYMGEGHDNFFSYFKDGALGIKLLRVAAERISVDGIKPVRDVSEKESVNAQEILGWYYMYAVDNGEGNAEEAAKWFQKAAEHGHVEAQYELGLCYAAGDGVKKDRREAAEWYRKAAEQGHANAQFLLGICYNLGDGVETDRLEAVKWFRRAAEQGHEYARKILGD